MPFTVAAALLDGTVGLRSFDAASRSRPELKTLLQKVRASERASSDPEGPRWTSVTVHTDSGEHSACMLAEYTAEGNVLDARLREKVRDCLAYGEVDPGGVDTIFDNRPGWQDRSCASLLALFPSSTH